MILKRIKLNFNNKQLKQEYKNLINEKMQMRSKINFTNWENSTTKECSCNGD